MFRMFVSFVFVVLTDGQYWAVDEFYFSSRIFLDDCDCSFELLHYFFHSLALMWLSLMYLPDFVVMSHVPDHRYIMMLQYLLIALSIRSSIRSTSLWVFAPVMHQSSVGNSFVDRHFVGCNLYCLRLRLVFYI